MNNKRAAVTIIAVFAVMMSSAAVMLSDGSDADTDYSKYWRSVLVKQGAFAEKQIYDSFAGSLADSNGLPLADPVQSGDTYIYEFTTTVGWNVSIYATDDELTAYWAAAVKEAMLYTKLDNPYAFWTWNTSADLPAIAVSNNGGMVKVTITMASEYATGLSVKVQAAKDAVAAVTVSGDSVADKMKSINSTATGYGFTDDFKAHPYAASIYGICVDDDKKLYTDAYAALYKAVCDKESIANIQVKGTLNVDSTRSAWEWNYVLIDGIFYAVDSAYNAKYNAAEAWVAVGVYSQYNGQTFGVIHSAPLASEENMMVSYYGYSWPVDNSLLAVITANFSWILVGAICVTLALVLVHMARKGDQ